MSDQLNPMEVVVIGSLNADMVVSTPQFPASGETVIGSSLHFHCGGKGANQAYAAACAGVRVAMVGQISHVWKAPILSSPCRRTMLPMQKAASKVRSRQPH